MDRTRDRLKLIAKYRTLVLSVFLCLLLITGNAWATLPASDNFNRSDSGDLGANWTAVGGYLTIPISSNKAVTNAGGTAAEIWTADSFPDDQFAQATMSTDDGNASITTGPALIVRASGSSSITCYRMRYSTTLSGIHIQKVVAGTASTVATVSRSWTSGEVYRLEVTGSSTTTITAYINGSSIGSWTDSSSPITTGTPGLQIFAPSNNQERADNFSAGEAPVNGNASVSGSGTTASAGTMAPTGTASVSLTGSSATSTPGTVIGSAGGDGNAVVAGESATSSPGDISGAGTGATAALTGLSSAISSGTVTASNGSLISSTGTFSLNTSTGNQSVTGIGFTPKLVIFWGNNTGNGIKGTFGAATSSSAQWAGGFYEQYAQTSCVGSRSFWNDKCIAFTNSDTEGEEASFVSMDSDGFTINVTAAGTSKEIHYLALGGDNLNASVGTMTQGIHGEEGDQTVTGLSFSPKVVMNTIISHNPAPDFETAKGELFLGCATSTDEWSTSGRFGITGTVNTWTVQRTDRWHYLTKYDGTLAASATMKSLNSDGFTVNWDVLGEGSRLFGWIALGGNIGAKCGNFLQPATTGNQSQVNTGVAPAATLFASAGKAPATGTDPDARLTIGAATSSSQRNVVSYTATDNSSPTDNHQYSGTSSVIRNISGSSPSTNSEADFVSNDANGFTINWTTADSTQREIVYLALGNQAWVDGNATVAGQGATTATGDASPIGTGNVSVNGQSASSASGTMTASGDGGADLSGQSLASNAGTLAGTGTASQTLTGSETTAFTGDITATGGGVGDAELAGSQADTATGAMTTTADSNQNITGSSTTASAGSMTVQGENNVAVTGSGASSASGTITAQGHGNGTVTGGGTVASSGNMTGSGDGNASLTGIQLAMNTGTMATIGTGGGGFRPFWIQPQEVIQ